MKCSNCKEKAVFINPTLCKKHFIDYFEKKVEKTIKDFSLLKKDYSVCVATSGGKDSLTILHILNKFGYRVTALLIDEGIHGYREHTKKDLENFCREKNIDLKIASFKELTGRTLDEMLKFKEIHSCTLCGVFRRFLLNKHSKGFDVIATGHNADDEAQTILMNLTRANTDLFLRGGPKTMGKGDFTQRIKPLYFCTEKEIMTYSLINNITTNFTECPYAEGAYRDTIRTALNDYELNNPGTRFNILNHYVELQKKLLKKISSKKVKTAKTCSICGEPSNEVVCKACRLLEVYKKTLS